MSIYITKEIYTKTLRFIRFIYKLYKLLDL